MTSAAVTSVQNVWVLPINVWVLPINVWVLPILDILHEILADASRTLQSPENGMHARWTLLAHSLRGLKPLA